MILSVIIPTLDEGPRLAALAAELRHQDPDCEIIVVDASEAPPAAPPGVRLMSARRGRGRQLAAGAAAARGEALLFLHADTLIGAGGLRAVRTALADPAIAGGNFRVVFDGGDRFAAWLTGFYARFRRHGLYYGDSAVFVRRAVYDAIGGMRPMALMEDYDFTRRLERHGGTVCIQEPPVVTSSRRFAGRRPAAIVAGWLVIHALYHVGVPPDLLARLYDSARRRQAPASLSAQS